MGKPSRDKGARRERQLVLLHTEAGIHAERVPLSGAARFYAVRAAIDDLTDTPAGLVVIEF